MCARARACVCMCVGMHVFVRVFVWDGESDINRRRIIKNENEINHFKLVCLKMSQSNVHTKVE